MGRVRPYVSGWRQCCCSTRSVVDPKNQSTRLRTWAPRFVAISAVAIAFAALITCFKIGATLPTSATSLNLNAVGDLLKLAKILTLLLIPALAVVIVFLSASLWIHSRRD
jgi:hypothetical protein